MTRTKQIPQKNAGLKRLPPPPKKTIMAPTPIRRRRRFRPGTVALREIRRYQTSSNLLIPKMAFGRLVRESMQNIDPNHEYRMRASAVAAIQEAAEAYITNLMEDTNLCAIHGRRVTITPRDMKLALRLRGD